MSLIRERLLDSYNREGFTVQVGHMTAFWYDTAHITVFRECASLWRDGLRYGAGWGMPWGELTLLEWLGEVWQPATIYGIGNAFGWSTVALRLAFPFSRLVAIDSGAEGPDGTNGVDLTNRILTNLGGGQAIVATSPQDVPATAAKLGAPINLAFIDGLHTGAQQRIDYEAVRPLLAEDHIILFHDVLFMHQDHRPEFKLELGFWEIAHDYPNRAAILSRTTTGIGCVWSPSMDAIGKRLARMWVQPEVPDQFGKVR